MVLKREAENFRIIEGTYYTPARQGTQIPHTEDQTRQVIPNVHDECNRAIRSHKLQRTTLLTWSLSQDNKWEGIRYLGS